MKLGFIFLSFSLVSFLAHSTEPHKIGYPAYEEEVNAVLALFNQDKLAPSYIRSKFSDIKATKTREVAIHHNSVRNEYAKVFRQTREAFDKKMKEETAAWRLRNPKGDFREYYKQAGETRKAFNDQQNEERKNFEEDLRDKRKKFDDFIKIRTEEFNKKFTEYSAAEKAQAAVKTIQPSPPANVTPSGPEQEFKEIPKGNGIKLSPVDAK